MPEQNWRKSSYSSGTGNGACVEVAVRPHAIGVRDSKNTTGPVLAFPITHWHTFLTTTTRR